MKFVITYKPIKLQTQKIFAVCSCGREMSLLSVSLDSYWYGCSYFKCSGKWTVPKIGQIAAKNGASYGQEIKIGYMGHPYNFSRKVIINGCAPSHFWVSEEVYNSIEVGQKIIV